MRFDIWICLYGTWSRLAAAVTEEQAKAIESQLSALLAQTVSTNINSVVKIGGVYFLSRTLAAFEVRTAELSDREAHIEEMRKSRELLKKSMGENWRDDS